MRDLISSIDRWIEPEGRYKPSVRAAWAYLLLVLVGLFLAVLFLLVSRASAHPAHAVDGAPLEWVYPPGCCQSAATSINGDCAPIASTYVTEGPDGYHVSLPVGAHPKLKTKGYAGVIPYKDVKPSPTGDYHICLSTDGAVRYCFFAGPRGS